MAVFLKITEFTVTTIRLDQRGPELFLALENDEGKELVLFDQVEIAGLMSIFLHAGELAHLRADMTTMN